MESPKRRTGVLESFVIRSIIDIQPVLRQQANLLPCLAVAVQWSQTQHYQFQYLPPDALVPICFKGQMATRKLQSKSDGVHPADCADQTTTASRHCARRPVNDPAKGRREGPAVETSLCPCPRGTAFIVSEVLAILRSSPLLHSACTRENETGGCEYLAGAHSFEESANINPIATRRERPHYRSNWMLAIMFALESLGLESSSRSVANYLSAKFPFLDLPAYCDGRKESIQFLVGQSRKVRKAFDKDVSKVRSRLKSTYSDPAGGPRAHSQ